MGYVSYKKQDADTLLIYTRTMTYIVFSKHKHTPSIKAILSLSNRGRAEALLLSDFEKHDMAKVSSGNKAPSIAKPYFILSLAWIFLKSIPLS